MNKWLAEICRDISRGLNKTPYAKIEGDDFANAVEKYRIFESVDEQKQKIKKSLNRIIEDAQSLINEIEKVSSE